MPISSRHGLPLALASCVIALAAPLSIACAAEPDVAPIQPVRTPPRLLPNQAMQDSAWPGRVDREALVYLRLDISASGEPSNVVAMEGGFHEPRFVRAAERIGRSTKFAPGTVDGVPVASTNVLPVRFGIPNADLRGLLPDFRRELQKVQKLVEAKDFAGAHFHAQWMVSEKVRLTYEYFALQAMLAQTLSQMGNRFEALAASRRATARTGMVLEQYEPGGPLPTLKERDFVLGNEVNRTLLRLRFVLGISKGAYLDALRAGADAQALHLITPKDPLHQEFQHVLAKVLSADALQAYGEIDPTGEWIHEPVFRNFTVRDVAPGDIRVIKVACGGKSVDEPYIEGREYQLPPDSGSCGLTFAGRRGAALTIAEYRKPRGPVISP